MIATLLFSMAVVLAVPSYSFCSDTTKVQRPQTISEFVQQLRHHNDELVKYEGGSVSLFRKPPSWERIVLTGALGALCIAMGRESLRSYNSYHLSAEGKIIPNYTISYGGKAMIVLGLGLDAYSAYALITRLFPSGEPLLVCDTQGIHYGEVFITWPAIQRVRMIGKRGDGSSIIMYELEPAAAEEMTNSAIREKDLIATLGTEGLLIPYSYVLEVITAAQETTHSAIEGKNFVITIDAKDLPISFEMLKDLINAYYIRYGKKDQPIAVNG